MLSLSKKMTKVIFLLIFADLVLFFGLEYDTTPLGVNTIKDFYVSQANMKSNLSSIKASETALESLKQEYEIGTKTVTDLVDEESKLLSANVDFLNSKKDYLVNYFIILSLEGSLLNSFENYLPEIN